MKFSHLSFAHTHWASYLKKGSIAIDATCGNGHDSLLIAKMILTKDEGALHAFDIQEKALENTKKRVSSLLPDEVIERVHFYHQCHSTFPLEIKDHSVNIIVYNLGYLPNGTKSLTTKVETTIQSLQKALNLIANKGLISVTCYPGHEEGAKEEREIINWAKGLDPMKWSVSLHKRINYDKAPSVLFIRNGIENDVEAS